MAGNTLGKFFRITTFGESHGKAIGVVIDGVKPNLPFSLDFIQHELNRRRPGQSSVTTPRNETDEVQILSGVFKGKTLGTPICLVIWNKDQRSQAYKKIKDLFRPGHAAYTYLSKFGIHDYRGGGRSSGRETAGRVAAGAFAKKILEQRGIQIVAYTKQVGAIVAKDVDYSYIEKNPIRCADPKAAKRMERTILAVKKSGDSVGGIIEAVVHNCPLGLGEPVFDKLEADLAKALLSIPAVRGFEIGSGFSAAKMKASDHNDEFYKSASGKIRTRTNYAGGILGGISNGEDIVVRVAVKPPSSILKPQQTVDRFGKKRTISIEGRHDPCLCPRIVPVVESMVALVLADHLTRQAFTREKRLSLKRLRQEIDLVDDMVLLLLAQRMELAHDVGIWKKKNKKTVFDKNREREIYSKRLAIARECGLDEQFVTSLYELIIQNGKSVQQSV